MTKAELRTELRVKLGDEIRLTGTATDGTVYTMNANELQQPDGHWNNMQLIISTTTDELAPQSEYRRIAKSTYSDNQIKVELPFSAAPESGDTFQIAIFNDAKYDKIARATLKEFSELRPLDFNESLSVTSGNKRFTPTSSSAIISVRRLEYYDSSAQEELVYTDYRWNDAEQRIEFDSWWTEDKTLTLYGKKYHTFPSADGDSYTVLDRDLDNFIDLCVANMLLSLTEKDFYDQYGKLSPTVFKSKDIVRDYSQMRQNVLDFVDHTKKRIAGAYTGQLSAKTPAARSTRPQVDTGAGIDGVPLPTAFWKFK